MEATVAVSLSELEVAETERVAAQDHLRVLLRAMLYRSPLAASSIDFAGCGFGFVLVLGGFWFFVCCCFVNPLFTGCATGKLPLVYQGFDRHGCNGESGMGSKKLSDGLALSVVLFCLS